MTNVRWGVLSTAKIGMEHVIPAIQQGDRCEVTAIASRDPERGSAVAERHGIPKVYGSYEGLLEDPDVDAVYIPLPNHLHAEWTMAAAGAGKHVLCEKPLAMSAAEAQQMIDVCAGAGVVFMEAFMYRLHPSWTMARNLVAAGRIGDLVTVQSWFSYFNDDPHNIRNVVEFGGGALMDIGCYCVNLSRLLFDAEPKRVEAAVTRHPVFRVDTMTSAILEFPDGTATFTCSTQTEPDQRVHIVGTEGIISIEIPFNIPPDRPTRLYVVSGGEPPTDPAIDSITFPPANQYTIEAELFAGAVLDGDPVPIPPADGVANMRVIEQVFAAAER